MKPNSLKVGLCFLFLVSIIHLKHLTWLLSQHSSVLITGSYKSPKRSCIIIFFLLFSRDHDITKVVALGTLKIVSDDQIVAKIVQCEPSFTVVVLLQAGRGCYVQCECHNCRLVTTDPTLP